MHSFNLKKRKKNHDLSKKMLVIRGLSTKGKKAELQKRLDDSKADEARVGDMVAPDAEVLANAALGGAAIGIVGVPPATTKPGIAAIEAVGAITAATIIAPAGAAVKRNYDEVEEISDDDDEDEDEEEDEDIDLAIVTQANTADLVNGNYFTEEKVPAVLMEYLNGQAVLGKLKNAHSLKAITKLTGSFDTIIELCLAAEPPLAARASRWREKRKEVDKALASDAVAVEIGKLCPFIL